MSKRLASIAIAAAAAAGFVLPAAPASADHCISWFTTPRQCAEHLLRVCYVEGTELKCPGISS